MNVVRAEDLIGRPIVSIGSGEALADIRDVVYDGEEHILVGFTLNRRGLITRRLKPVLSATSVVAIGPDAVMVQDDSAIGTTGEVADTGPVDAEPANVDTTGPIDLRGARPVMGNRVLSGDGTDLGEIVSVILAVGDAPRAVGYEIRPSNTTDTSFVPISAQMALSGENLILPPGTDDLIEADLDGFAASLDSDRSNDQEGAQ